MQSIGVHERISFHHSSISQTTLIQFTLAQLQHLNIVESTFYKHDQLSRYPFYNLFYIFVDLMPFETFQLKDLAFEFFCGIAAPITFLFWTLFSALMILMLVVLALQLRALSHFQVLSHVSGTESSNLLPRSRAGDLPTFACACPWSLSIAA